MGRQGGDANKVTQRDNAVTGDLAGRDVVKQSYENLSSVINIFCPHPADYADWVAIIKKITGHPADYIKTFVIQGENRQAIEGTSHDASAVSEIIKTSLISNVSGDIREQYDGIILGSHMRASNEHLSDMIKLAATRVKNREFGTAYRLFDDVLAEVKPTSKLYGDFYQEFLIVGFIHFTTVNDMDGLRSLLTKKRPMRKSPTPGAEYLIANILQEISSRDTDLARLRDAVQSVKKVYESVTELYKPAMANSLGLAYRRLGERTGVSNLTIALDFFAEGLKLNENDDVIALELKDQKAITHIRIFEITKDETHLDEAQRLLEECIELLSKPPFEDPRASKLMPRVLNNMGNAYKQRVLRLDDVEGGFKALSFYSEGAKYWTEKESKYEWALLKKNAAETKYALALLQNDASLLREALDDAMKTLKYRNLENSPYQWAKSVDVIFRSAIRLNDMDMFNSLNAAKRKALQSYSKAVSANESLWRENGLVSVIENGRLVAGLL